MNKKAFSLIELLAVIIIIAVLVLISAPLVLNVLNASTKSAQISEIHMIIDSAENLYAQSLLNGNKIDFNGIDNLYNYIETSKEKPKQGNLKISEDGKIFISVYVDNVCYTKDFSNDDIFIDESVKTLEECVPLSISISTTSQIENGFYMGSAAVLLETNGNDIAYCISYDLENDCNPGETILDDNKTVILTETSKVCAVGIRNAIKSNISCKDFSILKSSMLIKGTDFNYVIKTLSNYSNANVIIFENKITQTKIIDDYNVLDLSLSQDESIIGFVEGSTLKIQSDSVIMAHYDSSNMFSDIYNIEEIDLRQNFNTSYVTNMTAFFKGENGNLDKLKTIYFGNDFYTNNVIEMNYMFNGLNSIEELILPSTFNTENVQNMSAMFSRMTMLSTLDLGDNFDTSSNKNFSWMFNQLLSLKHLDLGEKFDTSSGLDMSKMFVDLDSLYTLSLGYLFDTSNVTNMDGMFNNNGKLETLDLGDYFNTINVTNMVGMFAHSNLNSVELGNLYNTENVTNMSYMFYKTNIVDLNLGESFDTGKVTNMSAMFSGMSKLETLELGNSFKTTSVSRMNNMFENLYNLNNLYLDNKFVINDGTNMNKMFYNSRINNIYLSNDYIEEIKGIQITNNSDYSSLSFTGLSNETNIILKSN